MTMMTSRHGKILLSTSFGFSVVIVFAVCMSALVLYDNQQVNHAELLAVCKPETQD